MTQEPKDRPQPYKRTPIFDEATIPAALRRDHFVKEGVWGVVRILEGSISLEYADPPLRVTLTPERPGLVAPLEKHRVDPAGPVRMQVEFYESHPGGDR